MKKLIIAMMLIVSSVFAEKPSDYITTDQITQLEENPYVLDKDFTPYYNSAETIQIERLGKKAHDYVKKSNYSYGYRYRITGIIYIDGVRKVINEIDGRWLELFDAVEMLKGVYGDVVLTNITMLTEKYSSYDGTYIKTFYNFCYDEMCYKKINYLIVQDMG